MAHDNAVKIGVLQAELGEQQKMIRELRGVHGAAEPSVGTEQLCCPLTLEIMAHPVIAADGMTYERSEIEKWFAENNTSPMTGEVVANKVLIPNYAIKSLIDDCAQ